jgi:hypothetical protein
MKQVAAYVGVCVLIIAAVAGVASAFVAGPAREAVWASASLAFAIQMVAFMVVRVLPVRQVMVGWGLGALLRMMSVVIYGVFVAKVWRAPIAPALLSYVAFLFLTTAVEPVFLKR